MNWRRACYATSHTRTWPRTDGRREIACATDMDVVMRCGSTLANVTDQRMGALPGGDGEESMIGPIMQTPGEVTPRSAIDNPTDDHCDSLSLTCLLTQ